MNKQQILSAGVLALLTANILAAQSFEKIDDGAAAQKGPKQVRPDVEGPRISPRLAALRRGDEPVQAVIVYRHQPSKEIFEQVEQASALHREVAVAEFNRLANMPAAFNGGIAEAREKMDQVEIRARQAARRLIADEIGPAQALKASLLEAAGARNVRRYWSRNMITADVDAAVLAQLAADPDVVSIHPAPKLRFSAVTNESIDVNVGVLGLAPWWNAGFNGAGQPVAVLDTGINAGHPAFRGKEIVGKAFVPRLRNHQCLTDDPDSAADRHGHGSHVAGIIAGAGESFLSTFQGTAPGVNRIFALKVGVKLRSECGDNAIDSDGILQAIDWLIENTSVKIINMSFGGEAEDDNPLLAMIIDALADSFGITVVAAAGNAGEPSSISDTGLNYNGITVANWDTRGTLNKQDDRVHPSSSRGQTPGGRFKPDVAAPGAAIVSASHEGSGFVRMTGTSMASPKVAGVVAVLHQSGIKDPAAVKALLVNTTDHAGWKDDRGWGLVNMQNAAANQTLVQGDVEQPGRESFRLYRGRNTGELYTTLAWNRHVSTSNGATSFHDLDLFVYDAAGKQIGVSESTEQNVEQVAVRTEGDVFVKVKAFAAFTGGITREKFALAISGDQFAAVAAPTLETRCQAESTTVSRGAQISFTCTVTNRGAAPVREAKATVNVSGSTGGPESNLDTLNAGQSKAFTFRFNAPNQAATFTLQIDASGKAFDEAIKSGTSLSVTVR